MAVNDTTTSSQNMHAWLPVMGPQRQHQCEIEIYLVAEAAVGMLGLGIKESLLVLCESLLLVEELRPSVARADTTLKAAAAALYPIQLLLQRLKPRVSHSSCFKTAMANHR